MPSLVTRGLGGPAGGLFTRGLGAGPTPPPPEVLPGDLLAAIVALARSDPGLRAVLGGRVYRKDPASPSRYPYLVVRPISAVTSSWTFGRTESETQRIQFSVFAATAGSADAALAALRACFDPMDDAGVVRARLRFRGGNEVGCRPAGSARLVETGRGVGARAIRHHAQDYIFQTELG